MLQLIKKKDGDFSFQRCKYIGSANNGALYLKYDISRGFIEDWCYVLRFSMEELDNKEIYRGYSKTLKEAKLKVESMINLVYKANSPGNAYLLKGVMLGFYREEDMEHLKIYNQKL